VALAATVECLHNASLVQDDYQDQSTLRRGTETVWKKYGTDTALCLTDLLISTAFAAVTSASEAGQLPAIISRMHAAISKTLRGQMRDTAPEQPTGSRLEASLQIAAAKSSPFFALAMELPLILRGFHEDIPTAGRACHHFGIGYQTYDDLHDLEQDEREGNDKNIVLAMGPPHESEHHVAHAADLAVSHLKRAANLAGLLPNDSGRLLYEQAGRLQNKITGLV
jgi:geranylgeranyl pyrophosphate synthase